ncbi:MAG: hypothetical protein TREMPRED_005197, partial [Tremellales sp. Tagirdzhanova-0007]
MAGPSRPYPHSKLNTKQWLRSSLPIVLVILTTFIPAVSAAASVASVTIYTGSAIRTTSTTAVPGASYTGLGAYDPTTLTPPSPPSPAITGVSLNVPNSPTAAMSSNFSVSIPQRGNFLGFSIELSVADVVLGKSGEQLKPQFLNYMANIKTRAGQGPVIRVGGNTQEGSTIFADGLPDGLELDKIKTVQGAYGVNTLSSPLVNYSPLLLYTMANISNLVSAEWFFGLSFNQSAAENMTGNVPIAADWAQKILGSNLRGLAVGNEPDLYTAHGERSGDWSIQNYISEYSAMTESVMNTSSLSNSQIFVGPSVCCQVQGFELADVFDAGFLNTSSSLAAVTVQHYPSNNCAVNGVVIQAQDIFADFLNHTNAQYLMSLYLQDSASTLAAGKEFIMLETNSASCGGFPGLSDSFGIALWMTDFALQMAWGNFSAAMLHVGGQDVYYNPFTPPPTNLSKVDEWTTGSIYYSSLVVAEAFGSSNLSQITDLSDSTDIYHPVYAIYESGVTTRIVGFNYVNDPTGASTYQLTLNGLSASQVFVRYLSAPTISEQYNITWANQTMGTSFASDGTLSGTVSTITIGCNNGQCVVPIPAPAIALVFLTAQAETDSTANANATSTFATTVVGTGSATMDPLVLQTSNGQNGPDDFPLLLSVLAADPRTIDAREPKGQNIHKNVLPVMLELRAAELYGLWVRTPTHSA